MAVSKSLPASRRFLQLYRHQLVRRKPTSPTRSCTHIVDSVSVRYKRRAMTQHGEGGPPDEYWVRYGKALTLQKKCKSGNPYGRPKGSPEFRHSSEDAARKGCHSRKGRQAADDHQTKLITNRGVCRTISEQGRPQVSYVHCQICVGITLSRSFVVSWLAKPNN
jgi:hypothetical protein